jgi:hypothetical protein
VCFCGIFAGSDGSVKIIQDSIVVSKDSLEVMSNIEFFSSFSKNIIACSPGIGNMMTYYQIGKYGDNQFYRRKISYFIGKENHPFILALYFAFAKHKKMTITPDMIWLLICQGVATHINLNGEKYRGYFTSNLEKQKINVREDRISNSFNDSNWISAISKISASLSRFIKPDLFNLFDPKFTTTGPAQNAVFQLTLMHTVKQYYEYDVATLCGIPDLTIEGERSDWLWILDNIDQFKILELEWWINELKPILNNFVKVYDGDIDKDFWCSILKNKGMSGRPIRVNGWVKNFFPYVLNDKKRFIRNNYLGIKDDHVEPSEIRTSEEMEAYSKWLDNGLKIAAFSTGLQKTTFIWNKNWKKNRMIFYSGFLGVSFDLKEEMLVPQVGYLIGKR